VRQCPTAPGVGAVGGGPTAEAAVADRRNALEALLAEAGRIPHDRALSGLIGGSWPTAARLSAPGGPRTTSGSTAPASSTWIRGRHGAASLSAACRCCRSRPATAR